MTARRATDLDTPSHCRRPPKRGARRVALPPTPRRCFSAEPARLIRPFFSSSVALRRRGVEQPETRATLPPRPPVLPRIPPRASLRARPSGVGSGGDGLVLLSPRAARSASARRRRSSCCCPACRRVESSRRAPSRWIHRVSRRFSGLTVQLRPASKLCALPLLVGWGQTVCATAAATARCGYERQAPKDYTPLAERGTILAEVPTVVVVAPRASISTLLEVSVRPPPGHAMPRRGGAALRRSRGREGFGGRSTPSHVAAALAGELEP